MRVHLVTVGLVLLPLLAACGSATGGPGPGAGSDPSAPETSGRPDADLVVGQGIVLDDGGGPEFCVGPVATSLPPQCGGPKVGGWDWSKIADRQTRGGTTWTGGYVLTGRYDGAVLTLTEEPVPAEQYDGPRPPAPPDHSLRTPCDKPVGGWRPLDPARTTERTFEAAARVARGLEGYAGLWVDQSINPSDDEMDMNDPRKLILNVRVVGDLLAAEREIRAVWGGALCVSRAQRTEAELRTIQREVDDVPGMLGTSSGFDVVDLSVVYDDGSLQRLMDDTYGAGVVRVHSALVPLENLDG